MSVYLGIDSSTQSLSAIAINIETGETLFDASIGFDQRLPKFGTENGVLPNDDPNVVHSDPLVWLAGLDLLLSELKDQGFDFSAVKAISGSGQQHGSVYLNSKAVAALKGLKASRRLDKQLQPALARKTSPIWMDSSTTAECEAIEAAIGSKAAVAELTGSGCFERFTGPQIKKFADKDASRYAKTAKIHLVSSFMASVLTGKHAPIDHGDGAGMNLMDITRKDWSVAMIKATASGLKSRLPKLVASDTDIGRISKYFADKFGFKTNTRVIAWSGDNPCSLIGVGLIKSGRACISLGTSDTYFGAMPKPKISKDGEGHVFGSPTGDYMSLICFLNGSLAREHITGQFNIGWDEFSEILATTKPGNNGKVLLPYYSPEITPHVTNGGAIRYGLDTSDLRGKVRGVIEAQMASMANHSRWMGVKTSTIYATGGASANREILQVMADMNNVSVYQFQVGNSAALGAALRAAHGHLKGTKGELTWDQVIKGFAEPDKKSVIKPNKEAVKIYKRFRSLYQACEAHALSDGEDPTPALKEFSRELRGL
ncbi:MAG: FGGY family carbohydrate kinase [Planctomycetota bacterium]|nr:FGGY family carbohydrate kinase [Planctomycetota bacterium]